MGARPSGRPVAQPPDTDGKTIPGHRPTPPERGAGDAVGSRPDEAAAGGPYPARPPPYAPGGPPYPVVVDSAGSHTSTTGGRRHLAIFGGIAVVVVIVAAGLWFVMSGDGGEGPPSEEEEAAAEQASAEDALIAAIPADLRERCEPVEGEGDATLAELSCEPAGDPDDVPSSVRFGLYASSDDLDDAYAAALDEAPNSVDDDLDCRYFDDSASTWSDAANGDGVTGELGCYIDRGNDAHLIWTLAADGVLGIAEREDEYSLDLYEWWAVEFGRVESDPFPNDDETALIALVPDAWTDSCVRAVPYEDALASIECIPTTGPQQVYYTLYDDLNQLVRRYGQLRRSTGVEVNTGETGECPAEFRWLLSEQPAGRVFCAYDEESQPFLVETYRDLLVLSEYNDPRLQSIPQLWDWWENDALLGELR